MLRDRNAEGTQPAAYVRLRVVSPSAIGELRWWPRLARELRSLLDDRPFDRQRVRRALAAARLGFYPSSTAIYPIPGDRSREYVSDRQRERTWRLDWPTAGLLDDKLVFFFMLRQLGVPTPDVTGTIISGRVHRIGHIGALRRLDSRAT